MKEIDSHAGIVINNIVGEKILESTKEIYICKSLDKKLVHDMNTIKQNIKKTHEDKIVFLVKPKPR